MTDAEIFRTAIDLIATSPTGQGNIHLGGVPAYNERYADYARRTLELLREYLAEGDEIAFAALPEDKHGDSDRRWGANIRINERFRAHTAVVAVLLLHEGCHLLREVRLSNKVEQEVVCRTLGVCLYRDLLAGVTLTIPDTSGPIPPQGTMTRRMRPRTYSLPSEDAPVQLTVQNERVQSDQLVDWVVTHGYAQHLTAPWIRRSIDWWRGLDHREPATKGHYLRVLARGGEAYGMLVLQILESIRGPSYRADWDTLVRHAAQHGGVDEANLQQALRALRQRPDTAARIRAVERRLPVNLGTAGAPGPTPTMRLAH